MKVGRVESEPIDHTTKEEVAFADLIFKNLNDFSVIRSEISPCRSDVYFRHLLDDGVE
jgi:hypothetical protein